MTLVISWCLWVLLFKTGWAEISCVWHQLCLTLSTEPQFIFIYLLSIFPLSNLDKWCILMVMNKSMSMLGKLMVWRERNVLYYCRRDEQLSPCPSAAGYVRQKVKDYCAEAPCWGLSKYKLVMLYSCWSMFYAHIESVCRCFFHKCQVGSSWRSNNCIDPLFLL